MANIKERDGSVILEADDYFVKIDVNKKVYIKKNKEDMYEFIDEFPKNRRFSLEQKKLYLDVFYKKEKDERLRKEEEKLYD